MISIPRPWPKIREECGVFGIYGHPEAAKLAYFGLYALQHRGQESAGIISSDGKNVREFKAMGLVSEVFNEARLKELKGHLAIGHVRYSTTGSSILQNAQPFCIRHSGCALALAHNGNIVNAGAIRHELEARGSIFQTTMDSEVMVHLLARAGIKGLENAITSMMGAVRGAYSVVIGTEDSIIGLRDPFGFRPLCIGRLGKAYVLSSETCALDLIQAEYIRDVAPGEVVIIDANGLRSFKGIESHKRAHCIFEFIYFARPDSYIFGQNVYSFRKTLGAALAKEVDVKADFVMPFPDSGNYAAVGYAQAAKIPLELAVIRNHYVDRTFIQPSQSMRDFGVRVKLNPVKEMIYGRRVIIMEDSIVRGTTSLTRIRAIREAGAKEITMLVSCPPIRFPCYYGIDFSTSGELIAENHSVEEIRRFLELDRLHYLSIDAMLKSAGGDPNRFCLACFNGHYPVPVDDYKGKFQLEQ
ncbi:amidophosphoribosyltransferase [Dissulfurimicrobium hydrothermale]|uniref:amidophosphoribosyltransferase n=1 Tax=Dissulfurimicrobium hydrothermale TaxID=1750598 RepID=UPI001EDC0C6D|nr:amidophosphoribosyltransferase [Dissulfurimicrobium hydrothermale]UKL14131.1 amidophosphoribosyltransferase [Dissulfurimicrobium hydrothermale]